MKTGATEAGSGRWRGSPSLIAAGRLSASALSLASAPILARSLGPVGRGEVATASAALYLIPIVVGMGVPTLIRRLAVIDGAQGWLRPIGRYSSVILVPSALVAALLSATLYASFEIDLRVAIFLGLTMSSASVFWLCGQSVLIASKQYVRVCVLQVAPSILFVVSIVACAIAGLVSATLCVGVVALGNVLNAVLVFLWLRSTHRKTVATRSLISRSWKFAGAGLAEAASNRLDQVISVVVIGTVQLGLYSVAATIATLPLMVAHALAAPYFVAVANSRGADRDRVIRASFVSATVVGMLVAGLLALAAPFGISIIFGSEFESATVPTLIALVGSVFSVQAFVMTSVLSADDRGWLTTLAQLAGLVVGLLGLVILGPRMGAAGSALASSVGYLVIACFLAVRGTRAWCRTDFRRTMFLRPFYVLLGRGAESDAF